MTIPALSFDEVARLYHEIRPRYPQELFNDLFNLTGLPATARILEIGAGTGIATLELVKRGFRIVALEPGSEMAAVLKYNLSDSEAKVVNATFEDWQPPGEEFPLVTSFTAFHWLDPRTRYQKIAAALAPGGYLAIVKYHHVAGGDRAFFTAAEACYRKYYPGAAGFRLPEAAAFVSDTREMSASGLFRAPITRTYLAEETYSRADYEKLLLTYSDHRALAEHQRSELLNRIGALIDGHYGGRIRKCYLHELILARKR
jgi:Trans-aconitate methyltransferase